MGAQAWRNRNGCWLVGCEPLVRTSSCQFTSELTTKPGSGEEAVSRFVGRYRSQDCWLALRSGPEGWARASQRLVVSTVGEGFSLESNRGWVSEQTSASKG